MMVNDDTAAMFHERILMVVLATTGRWRRGNLTSPAILLLVCGLFLSGCGTLRDLAMGPLESSEPLEGQRETEEGFSLYDSTITLDGVGGDSEAWSHQTRETTWETATVPGTELTNFGYKRSAWTFGSDGSGNTPDGGVRFRGSNGREIILSGGTGASASVPDPDGAIDALFSRVPPRLTLLVGTTFTTSTIGAGGFHGLGLETGLRWRQPLSTAANLDSETGASSLDLIAEYTVGHARRFRPFDGARGEKTVQAEFLIGFTPADYRLGLQLGWRIEQIDQYGGLDQSLDFSGPVLQLGWEFGPERQKTETSESEEDLDG
jgi:hypothetical protein